MICKLLFLVVLGLTYAQDIKLVDIDENGNHFSEILILDKKKNTLETRTPTHGKIEASIRMEFKNEGLYAIKQFATLEGDLNLCIFGKLDSDSKESVAKDEKDLSLTGSQMPLKRRIIQHLELPVPVALDEVPEVVAKFCLNDKRQFKIVKARREDQKSMQDIERDALLLAKAAKKDARKRAVVREFIACTNASTMKIMTCPGDKLTAKCKIRRETCTYQITCPMDAQEGGFNCAGLHKLESMVCCDYDC